MMTGLGRPSSDELNSARNAGGMPRGLPPVRSGQGPVERERAQRHDEGLESAIGDEHAVDAAGARRPGGRGIASGPERRPQQRRRHDGRQRRRRADRQVDAAGDDDQRHAERDAGVDRGLLQDVEEIALGQEVGRQRREDDDDDDQADQRAGIAQAERESEAAAEWAARLSVEDMG